MSSNKVFGIEKPVVGVLGLLVFACLFATGVWWLTELKRRSDPSSDIQPAEEKPLQVVEQKPVFDDSPPIATLSAVSLMTEYEASEIDGDARYKGKRVEIYGSVREVKPARTTKNDITLGIKERKLPPCIIICGLLFLNTNFDVQCTLRHEKELARIRPDQQVTLRGTCEGRNGNLYFKDCTIENVK